MEIEIERDASLRSLVFYFFRKTPDGDEVAAPINLEWVVLSSPVVPVAQPTWTLSYQDAEELMLAMASALDKAGVKTPEHHRLEGELESTRRHLADLRQMLKLG